MISKIVRTGWVFLQAMAERRAPYRSADRIREVQNKHLRRIILHAYETVPYYREHMREQHLKPQDFQTVGDLARLPLVDRDFLKKNQALFRSSEFPDEICSKTESGGGTTAYWDVSASIRKLSLAERDRVVWLKLTRGGLRKRQVFILPDTSSSITTRKFFDSQVLKPRFVVERFLVDPKEPFDQVAARIDELRPDVVFSYGSYLEQFSRYIRNRGRSYGMPKLWVYGADTLTDPWREVIQRDMGCRVIANYSSTECGRIGFECEEQQGYHLNIDFCPVRTVHDDGSPCADGEIGQVVVSNLINRATVLLNYLQGDLAEFNSAMCRCGRTLPRLTRLHGRVSEVVVMADSEKLTTTVFIGHLAHELQGALQFQIRSVSPGHILFHIVLPEGLDSNAFEQGLQSRFNDVYGGRAKAQIQFVSNIPRLPRGKFDIVPRDE